MNGNGSEVVEAMREAKELARDAWRLHANGPRAGDLAEGKRLWREYEEAAAVYRNELDLRLKVASAARAAA
jgi:hypothetical protein